MKKYRTFADRHLHIFMDTSKREIWIAWILLFRKIKARNPFYRKVLVPVSDAGYGMYLCHLLLLGGVSAWIRGIALPTPVQILATTVISFAGVALFSVLVCRIPKVGRLIIG